MLEERRGKGLSYSFIDSGMAVEYPDEVNSIVEKAKQ